MKSKPEREITLNGARFTRTALSTAVLASLLTACGGGQTTQLQAANANIVLDDEGAAQIQLSKLSSGEGLEFKISRMPDTGLLALHSDKANYHADQNFTDQDSFEYIVNDRYGNWRVGTITLSLPETLAKTDSGPAAADPISVPELTFSENIRIEPGRPIDITPLVAHPYTVEFETPSKPTFGTLALTSHKRLIYRAPDNFFGTDMVKVTGWHENGQRFEYEIEILVSTLAYVDESIRGELFALRPLHPSESQLVWKQIGGSPASIVSNQNGLALIHRNGNSGALTFGLYRVGADNEELLEVHSAPAISSTATKFNPFQLQLLPYKGLLVRRRENTLFVYLEDLGIVSMDISVPDSAKITALYATQHFIQNLEISDTQLFASHYDGIEIIDHSIPGKFVLNRSIEVESLDPVRMNLIGHTLIIKTFDNRLVNINIEDSSIRDMTPNSGSYENIYVHEDSQTLITTDGNGLTVRNDDTGQLSFFEHVGIIDAYGRNDFTIVLDTAQFSIYDNAFNLIYSQTVAYSPGTYLRISGDYALVINPLKGAFVFDISEIYSTKLLGIYNSIHRLLDADVYNNQLVLLDEIHGIQHFDLAKQRDLAWIDENVGYNRFLSVSRSGDYIYLGSSYQGLQTLDASDVFDIQITGTQFSPSSTLEQRIHQDFLLASNQHRGVSVYDLSAHPDNPEILAQFPVEQANDALIVDQTVIVANNIYGVSFFGIDTPEDAITFDTPGRSVALATRGNYLYVAELEAGISIYDISDIRNPIYMGTTEIRGWAYDIEIVDDIAYVANGTFGVAMLDISNPQQVMQLGVVEPDVAINCKQIKLYENELYAASGDAGVFIFDISTPGAPIVTGHYNTPESSIALTVDRDYIYNISQYAGLNIHDNARPSLDDDYQDVSFGSVLQYQVSWDSLDELNFECRVSNGTCYVLDLDPTSRTATVEWETGPTPGTQSIEVVVGNMRFYRSAVDVINIY
ncbi:MAG: hypothetical protein OEZ43_03815 [Gammaproteobacteria bacterium]|nr:hypothetical protein [Gammaproteobacteria bacterium]